MMRKRPMVLVMKCDTPSKKKNWWVISRSQEMEWMTRNTYVRGLHGHDEHYPARGDDQEK